VSASRGLPRGEPSTWLVLALSAVFVSLGVLFLAAPRWGAALFGLPAPEGAGFFYLPAIGLRDLAFGLYLLALARLSDARAVATVLAITTVIPVGDVIIVALARGWSLHILLHAFSGLVMAASAAWLFARSRSASEP
jgi:hypothetical protein